MGATNRPIPAGHLVQFGEVDQDGSSPDDVTRLENAPTGLIGDIDSHPDTVGDIDVTVSFDPLKIHVLSLVE